MFAETFFAKNEKINLALPAKERIEVGEDDGSFEKSEHAM